MRIERPVTLKLRPTWVILVGSELQKNKEASRAVQMAAIEGYAELLRNCGHGVHMQLLLLVLLPSLLHVFPTQTQVTLKYLDKTQMKDIRTKSAEFIHKQHIKGDNIPSKFVLTQRTLASRTSPRAGTTADSRT